jgi:hypothetical protein
METQCIQEQMVFQQLGRREVIRAIRWPDDQLRCRCGVIAEVEKQCGILKRMAGCFRDYRNAERIEYSMGELIKQRVYAIALGYEDLNDHDSLRHDVVIGVLCEKSDPRGVIERGSETARQNDSGQVNAQSIGVNA